MRKVCAAFQVILISSWALTESPPLVAQPSSTAAFGHQGGGALTESPPLVAQPSSTEAFGHQGGGALTESPPLVARPSSTEAFGHQGAGVDHSDNRGTKEDDQFSATKQGNPSKGIASHLDEETEAFVLTPNLISLHSNLEASIKINDSLNNDLRRKKREQNNCEMFSPGTRITLESQSTTLHVQANTIFTLDIKVDVSYNFNQAFTIHSESLGISRDIEWNAITVELSTYRIILVLYCKLEVRHGHKVEGGSWLCSDIANFNSMTITVTDCIKWYSGVMRPMCQSPTTVTASSLPRTPTAQSRTTPGTTPTAPGTAPPTVSSESGRPAAPEAPTSNPSSAGEQGRGTDDTGTVSEQSFDPLYWLLVLPLVAVIAVAVALGCLRKRKNEEKKAAIAFATETAMQPRDRHESINSLYGVVHKPVQRHESINSLYESNDVQLNPVCATGTWSPSSRDFSEPTSQEESIYEN